MLLDETRCILNQKMMPNLTAMVPELEIGNKYQISMFTSIL
jgi:hypothetical protein